MPITLDLSRLQNVFEDRATFCKCLPEANLWIIFKNLM